MLSSLNSSLLGIVSTMNIYTLKSSLQQRKLNKGLSSLFSASILGIFSSSCISCSASFSLFIAALFGNTSSSIFSFLLIYQTPLRLVTLLILLWSLFSTSNRINNKSCNIK